MTAEDLIYEEGYNGEYGLSHDCRDCGSMCQCGNDPEECERCTICNGGDDERDPVAPAVVFVVAATIAVIRRRARIRRQGGII